MFSYFWLEYIHTSGDIQLPNPPLATGYHVSDSHFCHIFIPYCPFLFFYFIYIFIYYIYFYCFIYLFIFHFAPFFSFLHHEIKLLYHKINMQPNVEKHSLCNVIFLFFTMKPNHFTYNNHASKHRETFSL